ncbi:MAG: hypothetical protein ABUL62_18620 [Myxococcales bacterium]
MTDMEGVLFVIKAWALSGLGLWVYRRYFERVAKAEPEFEAWCRSGPLLAALRGDAARLAAVERTLRGLLGERARAVATLGGWPWPNYALELELRRLGGVLALRALRADLLRTHGPPAPSLIAVLRDALNEHPGAIDDTWLHQGTVFGKPGQETPSDGWQLNAGVEPRPKLVARGRTPSWLPKLRDLPGEC